MGVVLTAAILDRGSVRCDRGEEKSKQFEPLDLLYGTHVETVVATSSNRQRFL